LLTLICPWHCSHRGTETGAACLSCHLKFQTYLMLSVLCTSGSLALRMRTSAGCWQPEGATLESCCSASSAHGTAHTEAQRLGLLACLATSNFKRRREIWGGSLPGSFPSLAPKMRTSADSWQPEGASLENCCSESSAHGTALTEAQRLGLLACLATSNFKRILCCPFCVPPVALLRKCERLQIPGSQKGLALKAVAQPPLPMALLAQRHREWGCLLVLPNQTSNVEGKLGGSLPGSFPSHALRMRTSAGSWQPEGASLESCCSASSAHGTARTEAQRLGLLACPPPKTSNKY